MKKFITYLMMVIIVSTTALGQAKQETKKVVTKTTQSAQVKKDGTPDKRFKENKKLKKDGTPDKRFKQNKKN